MDGVRPWGCVFFLSYRYWTAVAPCIASPDMAAQRKSRSAKKTPRSRPRRFRFALFFQALLVLAIAGAGGYAWYAVQDRPTQEKAEGHVLDLLDWGRQSRHVPHEVRLLLDIVADHVPLNIGHTVDPGSLSGDNSVVYAGAPQGPQLRILQNDGFIVGYDEQRRNPAWVAYRVFDAKDSKSAERPERFVVDERTRARVAPQEYTNSGYDRGHMAPNHAIGTLYGPQAQEQTFLMSNIVPQLPDLNRKVWRDLEARILRSYARRFGEVWVITGPVYANRATGGASPRIGEGVAVPQACFKILVDEHEQGLRALAFIIPQEVSGKESPAQFLVSIREVEQATGLDFFPDLPEQAQDSLESWVSPRLW